MRYQCQVCAKGFVAPPSAKRLTCSMRCRGIWVSRHMRGTVPTRANEGRLKQVHADGRAAVRKLFGELSVRELEIIKHFYWRAYNRGYQRALHRESRKRSVDVAA